jgi:hypothetical protein
MGVTYSSTPKTTQEIGVVYDPYTGTFGDGDGDHPLFDSPTDEGPFGLPTDDVEDDRHDEHTEWSRPAGDIPSGTVGSISYDRGDNEIVGRPTALDGDDGSWSGRTTAAERDAIEERGARDRSDTGNRNIRRAAGQHEANVGEGSVGKPTPAATLEDAAARLRDSITGTERTFNPDTGTLGLDRNVEKLVKVAAQGGGFNAILDKPAFTHTKIQEVPTFDGADFECEIYAVKMNAAGDWLVTVKVPFGYRHVVTDLSGAAGMNLKTHMELDGFAP